MLIRHSCFLLLLAAAVSVCERVAAASVTENVQSQYNAFPYPQLGIPDPQNNNCRTSEYFQGSTAWLQSMDHYVFDGELLHQRAVPLRVLVAGGGAGRDAILLAREMRRLGVNGSVSQFDLASASVQLATAWAQDCGVAHMIHSEQASIDQFAEAHAAKHAEPYDVIVCSGVLHHLEDPASGLRQLRSMLADRGVIQLMVYGKHGRAGTGDAQKV